MRLSRPCIALVLLVGLLACSAAQDENLDSDSAQADASSSPTDAGEPRADLKPLAQYPGAPYEDRHGVLWFGTGGAGAVRYDGNSMTVYTAQQDGLCSDRLCASLQDKRGDFWFGTSGGGVSRYDSSSFTTDLRRSTFGKTFGWGRFMGLLEDRAGNVWFGVWSPGGGAYRYDGRDFRYFSRNDGLGDGAVPSLSEVRNCNVWLGTTAGMDRLDGERFVRFTKSS